MKNVKFLAMAAIAAGMMFTACDKDDDNDDTPSAANNEMSYDGTTSSMILGTYVDFGLGAPFSQEQDSNQTQFYQGIFTVSSLNHSFNFTLASSDTSGIKAGTYAFVNDSDSTFTVEAGASYCTYGQLVITSNGTFIAVESGSVTINSFDGENLNADFSFVADGKTLSGNYNSSLSIN